MGVQRYFVVPVSIHAPVKGATAGVRPIHHRHLVSIHAPVKGATSPGNNNPNNNVVSIHAPVKGATIRASQEMARMMFQFTLP